MNFYEFFHAWFCQQIINNHSSTLSEYCNPLISQCPYATVLISFILHKSKFVQRSVTLFTEGCEGHFSRRTTENMLLHRNQGLFHDIKRCESNLTHIVTVKWSSRKLLFAWLLPSVWVIPVLFHRASLGHSGWFLTLHNIKRKGALGTPLYTQTNREYFGTYAVLCVHIPVCFGLNDVVKGFIIKGV